MEAVEPRLGKALRDVRRVAAGLTDWEVGVDVGVNK